MVTDEASMSDKQQHALSFLALDLLSDREEGEFVLNFMHWLRKRGPVQRLLGGGALHGYTQGSPDSIAGFSSSRTCDRGSEQPTKPSPAAIIRACRYEIRTTVILTPYTQIECTPAAPSIHTSRSSCISSSRSVRPFFVTRPGFPHQSTSNNTKATQTSQVYTLFAPSLRPVGGRPCCATNHIDCSVVARPWEFKRFLAMNCLNHVLIQAI